MGARKADASPPALTGKSFKELLNVAVAQFDEFVRKEATIEFTRQSDINLVLKDIYALHKAGETDPKSYSEFLTNHSVKRHQGGTNDYYLTVKALVPLDCRSEMRQRITQYGQVLAVLAEQNVRAEAVVPWLEAPERVGSKGRPLVGIQKALAMYRLLPSVQARNTERYSKAKKEIDAELDDMISSGQHEAIAELPASDGAHAYASKCVLAAISFGADGSGVVLRVLSDDPGEVVRLAKRFARP